MLAPSSGVVGIGQPRRDNEGDGPQQGPSLAPLTSSVRPCRSEPRGVIALWQMYMHIRWQRSQEGRMWLIQASSALSTSPGSTSDFPHPDKCLGCGQPPHWRELWVLLPSPALVWTQGEAAFGHLRSRLPCLDPACHVAQASPGYLCRSEVQVGEISSCWNLGELRPSS